jgi:hypothetical protein
MCGPVEILGSRYGGGFDDSALGRFGRTPDLRSCSAVPFGAPAKQSQHVVDDHRAVKVSALLAFPQTVARILWTGRVDTTGEHMFSYLGRSTPIPPDDSVAPIFRSPSRIRRHSWVLSTWLLELGLAEAKRILGQK